MSNNYENESKQLSGDELRQQCLAEQTQRELEKKKEFHEGIKLAFVPHVIAVVYLIIQFCSPLSHPLEKTDSQSAIMFLAMAIEILAGAQWGYVIPTIIVLAIMKKPDAVIGMLTVAGITVLAAGGAFAICTGIMMVH